MNHAQMRALVIYVVYPELALIGRNIWNAIAYGNGKFVAVSNDKYISSSTNGVTWTTPQNIGDFWQGITYGNGKFIAVGTNGYCTTSIDGVSWTKPVRCAEYLSGRTWQHIIFTNGKFIAVAGLGYTSTSIDDINRTTSEQIKDESGNVVTANLNGICAML